MKIRFRTIFILAALAFGFGLTNPGSVYAGRPIAAKAWTAQPGETIIVANAMDARFSRDYSTLLKYLRQEWIILEETKLPESIRDKNLVLIGSPDSPYTGDVMRALLSAEQIDRLTAEVELPVTLEIQSPWRADRIVTICSGADFIQRRDAAEQAVRTLIVDAPSASDWIRSAYEADIAGSVQNTLDQLRYTLEDELPLQDLVMDVESKPPARISAEQAAEDVARLFYLLSHGYSGYGFFNHAANFEQAQADILESLPGQAFWSGDAFAELLHKHLSFIQDCHITVGEQRFTEHHDFWYDTRYELKPSYDGYQFEARGELYTVQSIDAADPTPFLFPSLNREGEPVYLIGMLSVEEPRPIRMTAANTDGQRSFDIKLTRSDFEHFSGDVFREDVLGGIPVLRVHGFGDSDADELREFAQTGADYRDEPVVVLDIRGNGGGNERWPVSWIQGLTTRRAEAIFIGSELQSKTSVVGRANAFNYWINEYQIEGYGDDLATHTRLAELFDDSTLQPGWTGPTYPALPLIPNDTTVVVVMDGFVASAGEGLVLRISQLENVMVVGENSMGCLTFGNLSAHKLPHSGLMIWLPINFGLFPDQQFRESMGLLPDLWVPAADAVNFTVAALRSGTITTARPLSQSVIEQPFIPESRWSQILRLETGSWLLIAGITLVGAILAYISREKTGMLFGVGIAWLGLSWYLIYQREKFAFGVGFLLAGLILLIAGLFKLWSIYRSRRKA